MKISQLLEALGALQGQEGDIEVAIVVTTWSGNAIGTLAPATLCKGVGAPMVLLAPLGVTSTPG